MRKGREQPNTVAHLHKAIEACEVSIGQLLVVANTVPGYGISEKNQKKVTKVLKALKRSSVQLSKVANHWMR